MCIYLSRQHDLAFANKSIYKITCFSSIINLTNAAKFCYNMGITKPCTHFHPAPSTSTQLHPGHFSLHSALCNTLNIIRTKILHVIGNFPKFRRKNSKLSIFNGNWCMWYLGGADSKSRLRFLKFIFGQILAKKVKVVRFTLKLTRMVSQGY